MPNLPAVAAILILSVVAITGLGLASASAFSLLNAKQYGRNPIQWVVAFSVSLLSGVYFPPTVLPAWLQRLGAWLPQTHALHAARLCLSGHAALTDQQIRVDLLYLVEFAVVFLPVGSALFWAGMRKAEREGGFTQWS